jgi:hypothetical protein
MSLGAFLGGIGPAYAGFEQGQQDEINHQNALAEKDWVASQRQFAQGQQDRQLAAQQREDDLRAANQNAPAVGSAIPPTPAADGGSDDVTDPSSENAQNGMDVGGESPATPAPVAKTVTQDQHLRQIADNFMQAGDVQTSLKLHGEADQLALARSNRAYQSIAGSADSMSLPDLANASAKVFNDDMFPGKVTGVRDLGPQGVELTVSNTNTGEGLTRVFKNKADLLEAMQARYSPDTYAKLQADRNKIFLEAQAKKAEERAKGQVVPAGATFVPGEGDSRSMVHVEKTFRPTAAVAPDAAVQKYVTEFGTKGDSKLQPEQLGVASDYANHLFTTNPGMPAPMAARLGVSLAMHPDMVHTGFNPDTGTIDQLVTDPQTGSKFALRKAIADPSADPKTLPAGTVPADITKNVSDMVAKYNSTSPGLGDLYVQAANDPTKMPSLQSAILASDPRTAAAWKQSTPAQQDEAVKFKLGQMDPAVKNRLAAISSYLPKPAANGSSAAGGGAAPAPRAPIDPSTPPAVAAQIQARRDADDAAAAAKAKKDVDAAAAATASAQALEQEKSEIKWLSQPYATDSLTADQARDYLRRYNAALPDTTRRILQMKSNGGLPMGPIAHVR